MLVRKLAIAAVAASLALGTAGCTFISPVATANEYQPGDGVNVNLGTQDRGVALRNLVYLVGSNNEGGLIGSIVNQSAQDENVVVTAGATSQTVKVAAGTKVDFGYNGSPALLLGVVAAPGTLTGIDFSDSLTKATSRVPVLDATFSEYQGMIPSATASPTPHKG